MGVFCGHIFFGDSFQFLFLHPQFHTEFTCSHKLLGKTFQGNAKDYRPVSFAF